LSGFNSRFRVPAAQRGSAFTACPRRDLDLIFSLPFERKQNRTSSLATTTYHGFSLTWRMFIVTLARIHWLRFRMFVDMLSRFFDRT
jgi:hypothetical protein